MKKKLNYLLLLVFTFSFFNSNATLSQSEEDISQKFKLNENKIDNQEEQTNYDYQTQLYDQSNQTLEEEKQEKLESFKKIIESTYQNNDSLNAEREKTESIMAQKLNAWSNVLPNVGIDINYGRGWYKDKNMREIVFKDYGNVMDNSIYLQQPIFKSGRSYNKIKSINKQVELQENKLAQKEQEVIFDAIQATINLIQSKEILDLTTQNEESFKNSYEYVKAKKEVGRATISELSLSEARYSSAKSNTIIANNDFLNAKAIFLKVTKLDPNKIDIDYEFLFKYIFQYDISFDSVIDNVLNNNPQFKVAKNNYEFNRNEFNYSKTSFLPELYLNAEWGRKRLAYLSSERGGAIMLNLKVPIFQGGTEYASYKEKRHSVNEAKYTLNDVKETLTKESFKTYDDFLSAKNLVITSQSYRDASKLSLNSTITEEKVGRASIVDVLDRRFEYFNTEISLLKNKSNLILNYYLLKMLMGNLNINNF